MDQIIYLADILERCDFQAFWNRILGMHELSLQIVGFADSIRKFVCHVVGITFQTVEKALLSELLGGVDGESHKKVINFHLILVGGHHWYFLSLFQLKLCLTGLRSMGGKKTVKLFSLLARMKTSRPRTLLKKLTSKMWEPSCQHANVKVLHLHS